MKYTIKHIRLLLDNRWEELPKCLGVELVDLGFLRYKKLNSENYNYWWYEVADKSAIDPKQYTYEWEDMEMKPKCQWLRDLVDYHEDSENMYGLITNVLNLESAKNLYDIRSKRMDTDILLEMYYGHKTKKVKQPVLEFDMSIS